MHFFILQSSLARPFLWHLLNSSSAITIVQSYICLIKLLTNSVKLVLHSSCATNMSASSKQSSSSVQSLSLLKCLLFSSDFRSVFSAWRVFCARFTVWNTSVTREERMRSNSGKLLHDITMCLSVFPVDKLLTFKAVVLIDWGAQVLQVGCGRSAEKRKQCSSAWVAVGTSCLYKVAPNIDLSPPKQSQHGSSSP